MTRRIDSLTLASQRPGVYEARCTRSHPSLPGLQEGTPGFRFLPVKLAFLLNRNTVDVTIFA
jgi:hypothetical protein